MIEEHRRLENQYVSPRASTWYAINACEAGPEFGGWQANTGNGYYGGLQMDISFQRTYGPEYYNQYGTANNWPVWAQMHAADRAVDSGRGFHPWPRCARKLGLI